MSFGNTESTVIRIPGCIAALERELGLPKSSLSQMRRHDMSLSVIHGISLITDVSTRDIVIFTDIDYDPRYLPLMHKRGTELSYHPIREALSDYFGKDGKGLAVKVRELLLPLNVTSRTIHRLLNDIPMRVSEMHSICRALRCHPDWVMP